MPSAEPFVISESQCELERWEDPLRGAVSWRTLLSADRTPTDSLTLGVASVSATEADLRLHRHDQAEAYYILSGQGVLDIEGAEYPLSAGVTAFIPGGRLHGARATGAAPLRLLYVLCADSFSQVHYEFPAEAPPAPDARPGGQ